MDIPGSLRSTGNAVVEGLISYGRAQSFLSGSIISSSPLQYSLFGEDDYDGASDREGGDDAEDQRDDVVASVDDLIPFRWDGDTSGVPAQARSLTSGSRLSPVAMPFGPSPSPSTVPTETSPLLRRLSLSFQTPSVPRAQNKPQLVSRASNGHMIPSLRRRISQTSDRSANSERLRGSTFGQSLFNSIAVLLGVGVLAEPYAFAQAGWIMGSILTMLYGLLTCYTAKILAKIIFEDHRVRSYADCGRKAFGERSSILTQLLFSLELFTVSVVLVVLYSDSMQAVLPQFSSNTYKFLGLVILIPTAFLPLSVISYTSLLSIIATFFIVVVLVVDGFSKHEAPGSLFEFARTSLWPASSQKLGLSFGLLMAGFSGHAVIPSIARDMRHPEEFDSMINYAFVITTIVYGAVGACGYLMFGDDVSDEISRDLLNTTGYNPTLGQIGLWMLVIGPITKFSLSTRPLNIMFEMLLNIDPYPLPSRRRRLTSERLSSASLSEQFLTQASQLETPHSGIWHNIMPSHFILFGIERITLVIAIVGVALVIPTFGTAMSILGAFCAFTLCVIGPLAAKLTIYGASGWTGVLDSCLLGMSVVMCAWGTAACVMNREESL